MATILTGQQRELVHRADCARVFHDVSCYEEITNVAEVEAPDDVPAPDLEARIADLERRVAALDQPVS